MKAAEDQRVREELEEKRKMAEKRKEEKRLQREVSAVTYLIHLSIFKL